MKPEEALKYAESYLTVEGVPIDAHNATKCIVEALEKQIPFEPETDHLIIGVGRCKCGVEFIDKKTNYCGNCGQKLMWK